ncbi:MAG: hypothetical protein ABSF69_23670 [Polyangiaceae bacterium]|jgi:hypothetical protein
MKPYYLVVLGTFSLMGSGLVLQACSSNESNEGPSDSGTADSTTTPETGVPPVDASSPDAVDGSVGDVSAVTEAAALDAPPDTIGMTSDAAEGGGLCAAFDAGTLDEASVAAGLAFIENTGRCYHCHQTDTSADAAIVLSGNDASISDSGPIYPPNLTPDLATGLGCWSNEQIANAILYGIDPADGGHYCVMPTFGLPKTNPDGSVSPAELTDASVGNVVEFLRSLAPVENEVPQTVCPASAPVDSGTSDAADAGEAGAAADAAGG